MHRAQHATCKRHRKTRANNTTEPHTQQAAGPLQGATDDAQAVQLSSNNHANARPGTVCVTSRRLRHQHRTNTQTGSRNAHISTGCHHNGTRYPLAMVPALCTRASTPSCCTKLPANAVLHCCKQTQHPMHPICLRAALRLLCMYVCLSVCACQANWSSCEKITQEEKAGNSHCQNTAF